MMYKFKVQTKHYPTIKQMEIITNWVNSSNNFDTNYKFYIIINHGKITVQARLFSNQRKTYNSKQIQKIGLNDKRFLVDTKKFNFCYLRMMGV